MTEKIYSTHRKRLAILRSRGMSIPTTSSKERNIIKKYNYYNLVNGYKDPFLLAKSSYPKWANLEEDYYINGTKPSHLESLYLFDENLRKIFLEKLLKIEDVLKDILVQSFYEYHTDNMKNHLTEVLHRESEYLKRDYYNLDQTDTYVISEKSGLVYTKISSQRVIVDEHIIRSKPSKYSIKRDSTYHSLIYIIYQHIANQRSKNDSIYSYLNKHTYLPMWILSNILTFGNISKMFEVLTVDVQNLIIKKLKLDSSNMANDLSILNTSRVIHILSLFRNSCAHNERIYCRKIHIPIDDEFMEFLHKCPFAEDVLALKGTQNYLNKRKYKKKERIQHSIYVLIFCISLFLKDKELEKFKKKIKQELDLLKSKIPAPAYENVLSKMGLDFDWYNLL